jgi:hypothetical protein
MLNGLNLPITPHGSRRYFPMIVSWGGAARQSKLHFAWRPASHGLKRGHQRHLPGMEVLCVPPL